jgi:copper transporter 1
MYFPSISQFLYDEQVIFRALAMTSHRMSTQYETISRYQSSEARERPPDVEPDIQDASEPTMQQSPSTSLARPTRNLRRIAPFIPAHDFPRGAIHASQALLGYLLMLAVMRVLSRFALQIIPLTLHFPGRSRGHT